MGACFNCLKVQSTDPQSKSLLGSTDGTYKPPTMIAEVEPAGEGTTKPKAPLFKMNAKITIDDFVVVKCIGRGSFAKVMMVKKKDSGKTYAMKVLSKKDLVRRKQVLHTMTERQVISNLSHPFIVSLRFAFQTDAKLYLVLDFFNGGELFWHLKNENQFTETRTRFYAAEIVLALECLHENGIIYRDMKPENLLLDADGHIRLTDFGLSKDSLVGDAITHTFCGTPEYLAPEVIKQEGYGKAVDWWALGVLIYEMLQGLPPFYDQNLRDMYDAILHQPIPFPRNFSKEVKDIINQLMERDPSFRLGSKGAQEVKDHEFFYTINFIKLFRKELPVPYKPAVRGEDDYQNVDEEFLQEKIQETAVEKTGSMLNAKDKFPGFTYVNDKNIDEI